jgi:serine/threonine-protein kinase HipA
MGALRISRPEEQTFLADEARSAPPVTRIAELQAVAFELTRKKQDDLDKIKEWLKVLAAPGSSLGGARPKANMGGTKHPGNGNKGGCNRVGGRYGLSSCL